MDKNLEEKILKLYRQGIGKKTIGRTLGISEWQVRKLIKGTSKDTTRKVKRIFFDIETSYNIVKTWQIGYNINLNYDNIIEERAIICLCYKWEGDNKVHSISWDDGDDKPVIEKFIEIMNEADELVGHNIIDFDTKFFLTRAAKHGILALPKYSCFDTLKKARNHFNFNSNKLDYVAKFLGLEGKMEHEGLKMWDDVILRKDKSALERMIAYCKQDVVLTEKVYNILRQYSEQNIHHGVLNNAGVISCPNDGSMNIEYVKMTTTKSGGIKRLMKCNDCNQSYFITNKQFLDSKLNTDD